MFFEVDALRTLMLAGSLSTCGLRLDFGLLTLVTIVLVAIGLRLYPRVVVLL